MFPLKKDIKVVPCDEVFKIH